MTNRKYVYFLTAGIIAAIALLTLSGCTKEDHNNERVQNGITEKMDSDKTENEDGTTRPPDISLFVGSTTSSILHRYSYCWNEMDCTSSQKNPKEVLENRKYSSKALEVKPNQTIKFTPTENAYNDEIIIPDSYEAAYQEDDEEIPLEVNGKRMIAPEKAGKYYVNIIIKWDKEIKGEAVYALEMRVK